MNLTTCLVLVIKSLLRCLLVIKEINNLLILSLYQAKRDKTEFGNHELAEYAIWPELSSKACEDGVLIDNIS